MQNTKITPDASKILLVRQLPYKITSEDMYELFGKYGSIQQIRLGNTNETRGRAFVVYYDVQDACNAAAHLNGYNVSGRYLGVSFYRPKLTGDAPQAGDLKSESSKSELDELRNKFGV